MRTRLPAPLHSLLLTVLVACGGGRTSAQAPTSPRLASLSPPITETVFALGAADQLVARSTWCSLPAEAEALPAVGSALGPDLEALARLSPTHILTESTAAGSTVDLEALAPTITLPWLTLDDVVASTRTLGTLTGTADKAEALAQRMASTLGGDPPDQGPRVAFLLGVDGLARGEVWFIKPQSLHGRVLHAAGGRNVVDTAVEGAPTMSVEAFLRTDPDVILVLQAGAADADALARVREAWQVLPALRAVQQGRIGVLAGPGVMATGPAILDLVPRVRTELERLVALP